MRHLPLLFFIFIFYFYVYFYFGPLLLFTDVGEWLTSSMRLKLCVSSASLTVAYKVSVLMGMTWGEGLTWGMTKNWCGCIRVRGSAGVNASQRRERRYTIKFFFDYLIILSVSLSFDYSRFVSLWQATTKVFRFLSLFVLAFVAKTALLIAQ